ncbi:hypothetical protein SKAU_G00018190 [Synaphobranchus kaupii]|uniref:BED-type domain-containing protein n=1 Tax=Synaphobranchus kaupii TaxID=118154 RepID=A0A9Q1JBY0_SYNKA|nr:hypothetical protein SKAU_G00018190 [Synaphobranchus kaupii]
MEEGEEVSMVEQESPWPYLDKYMTLTETTEKTYVFRCLLCSPKMKLLSTSKTSNTNLRTHIQVVTRHSLGNLNNGAFDSSPITKTAPRGPPDCPWLFSLPSPQLRRRSFISGDIIPQSNDSKGTLSTTQKAEGSRGTRDRFAVGKVNKSG